MNPSRLLPLLLVGLVACEGDSTMNTLVAHSDLTADINLVYERIFWWTAILFVLVQGLLLWIAFRFKATGNETTEPEQVHGNTPMEIAWTIAPVFILLHIAIPTVSIIFKSQAPAASDALVVNSVGKQWWFAFSYPGLGTQSCRIDSGPSSMSAKVAFATEGERQKERRAAVAARITAEGDPKNCIVTANEIHVPMDREVEIRLQSDNVIHAFWLPQLAAKRDMIPGRVNRVKFKADKAGLYLGQCAEYCSDSHALMKFRVVVDTPEDFAKWVEAQAKPAVADASASAGKDLFGGAGQCAGCHQVAGQFDIEGVVGPNLTHVASRTSLAAGILANGATFESAEIDPTIQRANLIKWIRNAPATKPGTVMPVFEKNPNGGLEDAQIEQIVDYLMTLK